ncbi:hypothetical protein DFH11DRAFT_1542986 [Phellopilus nigrolimitatus]|nr:hypothetical protein DFH11DRAFT_1542986 [Phellopilus nigrolimitatus]
MSNTHPASCADGWLYGATSGADSRSFNTRLRITAETTSKRSRHPSDNGTRRSWREQQSRRHASACAGVLGEETRRAPQPKPSSPLLSPGSPEDERSTADLEGMSPCARRADGEIMIDATEKRRSAGAGMGWRTWSGWE